MGEDQEGVQGLEQREIGGRVRKNQINGIKESGDKDLSVGLERSKGQRRQRREIKDKINIIKFNFELKIKIILIITLKS